MRRRLRRGGRVDSRRLRLRFRIVASGGRRGGVGCWFFRRQRPSRNWGRRVRGGNAVGSYWRRDRHGRKRRRRCRARHGRRDDHRRATCDGAFVSIGGVIRRVSSAHAQTGARGRADVALLIGADSRSAARRDTRSVRHPRCGPRSTAEQGQQREHEQARTEDSGGDGEGDPTSASRAAHRVLRQSRSDRTRRRRWHGGDGGSQVRARGTSPSGRRGRFLGPSRGRGGLLAPPRFGRRIQPWHLRGGHPVAARATTHQLVRLEFSSPREEPEFAPHVRAAVDGVLFQEPIVHVSTFYPLSRSVQSSRHTPCAVALRANARIGGRLRHTECAYYFTSTTCRRRTGGRFPVFELICHAPGSDQRQQKEREYQERHCRADGHHDVAEHQPRHGQSAAGIALGRATHLAQGRVSENHRQ